jgi:hypothetical protein
MRATRQLRRSAALCALACTLAFAALAASAVAAPRDQERYYASYGDPRAAPGALAQEQYYASPTARRDPAKAPDAETGRDTRLILALSIGGALALVAVAGVAGRRRSERRHDALPA